MKSDSAYTPVLGNSAWRETAYELLMYDGGGAVVYPEVLLKLYTVRGLNYI